MGDDIQKSGERIPLDHLSACGMIGRSPAIQKVFEDIQKVADSDSTVLISGESGTGKELVARAIHMLSSRRNASLVPVNCGAIPGELLESELFGHVKGAFTGAISNRQGRFELAQGGSIFLDEIGDMPSLLQVKLLRVLQERQFEPVGGTKAIVADVRIIAATNRDLEEAVKERSFREDLFYRLNVIPIHIPTLRERKADVPVLIEHFARKFCIEKKRNICFDAPEVMDLLLRYDWPGNVRELENLVERLVVFCDGTVQLKDLPPKVFERVELAASRPGVQGSFGFATHTAQMLGAGNLALETGGSVPRFMLPDDGVDLRDLINQFENDLLMQALSRTRGNKNKASELLKMNRTTLVEKLKKKNLQFEV
ncbi:MAG TPA: sigma-54 dependent transcriptional regulator [Oligoflexia bacterium]|nr:sigma-54 dependent transcriptional regulator [Oligoflexia bacterium]